MDCPRGQALIRTCLLLLICLQAGAGGQSLGPLLDRRASSGHAIQRRLLQAPSPGAATPGEVPSTDPPVSPPTLTPTDAPTPPPAISTAAPTPPPTKPATPPPTTPLPTTAAPVVTTLAPTPAPTTPLPTVPPLTPAPELTTLPPAVTPAAATLPPPTIFTPTSTPIPTTVAPLAPPTLTPSPTVAPVQPTVAPPGKTTPPPTLAPSTLAPTTLAPTLSPTRSPTPPATSPPPGKTPAPLTVNASAPAPPLLSPVVTLASPPPAANTSGAAPGTSPPLATPTPLQTPLGTIAPTPSAVVNATPPACLPGTPSCDPLVVKLLLSNTDYGTLSQYLLTELAAQLGLQSNQFQFSAVNAGTSREFNVTFYILPVSGFNISEAVAANVSDALSTHKVQLQESLFGNYTFFYAEPLSAMERGSAAPLEAPAPAPLPAAPAPAPSPENGTFPPVNDGGGGGGGSSTIIIVAAAVGGVAVLAVCALVMFCCLCRRKRVEEPDDGFSEYSKTSLNPASTLLTRQHQNSFRTMSSAASLPSDSLPRPSSARVFTYEELADATNGWDPMYLLGEGGFGKVYKGVLKDGIKVAVKKLTVGGHQGDREFQVEVEMLSRLHHRHLVKLIGYYYRPDQQLLCYELVMNGSLENHLHGQGRSRRPPGAMWQTLQLDWDARMKIAIGAARGLAYLHEDCQPTVIHRDMKASNILLEDNFHAKVADFGLAKIAPDNRSDYLTTRVMGTFGYVAPEYAMTGHIMVKSDVYSYGVVLLELLTGRKPVDMSQPQGQENLVTWARPLMLDPEKVEDLVDPRLGDAYPFEDLLKVATIANACVHPDPARRPHMGEVVQKLRALQRTAGAESHVSDDSANGRDMEALASTLSGPLPAYTQSQPYPGGYMSTAYPPFPMHRSMEMPPHTPRSTMLSENTSRNSSESGRSQALMLDHDQLARTTVFSEGLEEGR